MYVLNSWEFLIKWQQLFDPLHVFILFQAWTLLMYNDDNHLILSMYLFYFRREHYWCWKWWYRWDYTNLIYRWIQRGDRESGHPPALPAGKLQEAKGFLRNIGRDPVKNQMRPFGSNCSLSEVHRTLCEILLWLKKETKRVKRQNVSGYAHVNWYISSYGPRREKTCFGGLRTTQAQTSLRIRAV